MRRFFYPALITVFLAGCGSESTVSKNESNVANKNNTASVQVNPAYSSSNQMNALPPVTSVNQPNVNSANALNANQTLIDGSSISKQNLERLKSKGGGDMNAAPIPAVKATPHAAPDNSELSSTMNSKGVPIETRVFKSNPMLAKVERTFEDIENPVTKVYLKNGKVLTMPKGAVEKTESATADEILRAVGAKP